MGGRQSQRDGRRFEGGVQLLPRFVAILAAFAISAWAILPASAGSTNLQSGSCFSTGGSSMAQSNGLS